MDQRPTKAVYDEDNYIANVDYYMRVLTLLTAAEAEAVIKCWGRIIDSGDFFDTVFTRMISERGELFDDDLLSNTGFVKEHSCQMTRLLAVMMEGVTAPEGWVEEALRVAALHMLYAVDTRLLQVFRAMTMAALRGLMGEELTPKVEDPFGRFMDCLVAIMDPLNEASPVTKL